MSRKLFTVGPVNVEEEVLAAMTKPMITHRSKEYKALHGGIMEKMKKALDTDQDILLVAGSASVFLEGAIRNGVGRKSLGMTNGSFGLRSIEIARLNGKEVAEVAVPWGKALKPEHLEGRVSADTEMVHWVSNESSTGVLNDSSALADEVRAQNPDALVMIDAVTSAFATDLKLRELEPDALIFGTQKALALPPGLAMVVVSDALIEKSRKVPDRGFYTDLQKLKKQNDEDYALTTPPVSLLYALDLQLDRILKEGMPARYRRHREMAQLVERWSEEKLHGIFPEEGHRSDTIGVLNRGDLDFGAFHSALKSRGYEISNGYGEVKESTFRIGHMGDLRPTDIKMILSVMDEILEEM
ncbi:MAG: alanine--glyoxylate aminotransferase family protein [Euryarchaeota archaeon]|nr:alanine--glyoxylate aminotransferase family protein [Euryarchaeota archaeon]